MKEILPPFTSASGGSVRQISLLFLATTATPIATCLATNYPVVRCRVRRSSGTFRAVGEAGSIDVQRVPFTVCRNNVDSA